MGTVQRSIWVVALLSATLAPSGQARAEWTLKSALKHIDQATKGVRWLTAEAAWTERLQSREFAGAARLYVDLAGRIRGEVEAGNPRVVLVDPPYVHIYSELDETAETASMVFHPDLIVQYVMAGFAPAGSAMKKDYKVTLVGEEEFDGAATLAFWLVPKDKEVAKAVPVIRLWVDRATGLPVRHEIRHRTGDLKITARYDKMTVKESLAEELFRAEWPEGTQRVRRQP